MWPPALIPDRPPRTTRGDPGSVPHRVEEFHLQLEELLIEVWPVLPAQQELEDAPPRAWGCLLPCRSDVAATRKERAGWTQPCEDSQPQGKGGQWRGCRGSLEEPASRTEYPGLGVPGSPIGWSSWIQTTGWRSAPSLSGQGKVLAAVIPWGSPPWVTVFGQCAFSPGYIHHPRI